MEKIAATMTTLFITIVSLAGHAQDNSELKAMAEADQSSRMGQNIDWKVLAKEDSIRRQRVLQLIDERKVLTPKDHHNAGIIFQHGTDTISSKMAVQSFKTAIDGDSTLNRWWYAAAVDRDLMWRHEPQIYGTQYRSDETGKLRQYNMDTTQVTDLERVYYGVGTLQEQRDKERLINLRPLASFYAQSGSITEMVDLIRSEHARVGDADYNVTEGAVNTFAYQLLQEGKLEDALEIFKLNIELYPEAWNTYDSYGEALLKVGREAEAYDHYAKSLRLNPENETARKVLEKQAY